jgi:hypothetical protein
MEVQARYGDFSPSDYANHSPEIIFLAKPIDDSSPGGGIAA